MNALWQFCLLVGTFLCVGHLANNHRRLRDITVSDVVVVAILVACIYTLWATR